MVVKYTYHQIYHLNHLNVPFSTFTVVGDQPIELFSPYTVETLHPVTESLFLLPAPSASPSLRQLPFCLVSVNSTAVVKYSLCPWVTGVFHSA